MAFLLTGNIYVNSCLSKTFAFLVLTLTCCTALCVVHLKCSTQEVVAIQVSHPQTHFSAFSDIFHFSCTESFVNSPAIAW